MKSLLTPIIFCGPGANLYPLCDASTSASSSAKALLPLANRPMLAFALQNVLSAGLSHCIVLAPSSQHSAILRALSSIRLVPPPAQPLSSSDKKRTKEAKDERVGLQAITVVDGTLSGSGTGAATSDPSTSSTIGMRVELLPLGPHDGHSSMSSMSSMSKLGDKDRFRHGPLGTAELLRWVAWLGKLNADPLVLPVDLLAPAFPLRDLIDAYVQAQAKQAGKPTACCALYERGAGEGVGREREREGPPRLISAFSTDEEAQHHAAHRLVFLRDSDLSSDLDVRRSLLEDSPRTRISTRLLDAHAYILNMKQILPLLEANQRLTSLRDHVLPLVAKASWMQGLREKASWPIDTDIVGDDTAGSPDGSDDLMQQSYAMFDDSAALQQEAIARSSQTQTDRPNSRSQRDPVRCLAVVVRLGDSSPPSAATTGAPRFVARANTVATYLECNRWLLKAMNAEQTALAIPEIEAGALASVATANTETPFIASSAQISADSLLGQGIKVGERASIKRSIIGHNCDVGRGARLAGCILMDGAKVLENAQLENVICCVGSKVGERSKLKDCDVGAGVVVSSETNVKNEKMIGDQGDDDDDDEQYAD